MAWLEHKIPPPAVMLVLAAGMWAIARVTPTIGSYATLRWIGAGAFIFAALAVAGAGVLKFRRARTTISPENINSASVLVTTGIYGFTRNPMYLGLTALQIGWAIYVGAPWALIGPIVFVLFISRFQVVPEETALEAKFGQPYLDYKHRVRRWL